MEVFWWMAGFALVLLAWQAPEIIEALRAPSEGAGGSTYHIDTRDAASILSDIRKEPPMRLKPFPEADSNQ